MFNINTGDTIHVPLSVPIRDVNCGCLSVIVALVFVGTHKQKKQKTKSQAQTLQYNQLVDELISSLLLH